MGIFLYQKAHPLPRTNACHWPMVANRALLSERYRTTPVESVIRERLRTIAADHLRDAAGCHQLDHTVRVVENTRYLAAHEPLAIDADVLEAAAWLHDIGRGTERERGESHAIISTRLAASLLPECGFTTTQTEIACAAIADHRYSAGRVPASGEGMLLQDADRLDALGAIGIARVFTEGAGRELYHPDDPFAERRTPDDDRFSIDHFFVKLLRLPATLHTPTARALAESRVAYMRAFLARFAAELSLEA